MTIQQIINKIDQIGIDEVNLWDREQFNLLNIELKGLVKNIKIDITRQKVKELLDFKATEKSTEDDLKMYYSRLDQSAETIREHML